MFIMEVVFKDFVIVRDVNVRSVIVRYIDFVR